MATGGNLLYYGDNLDALREHVATESVDLIYLDPPVQLQPLGTGALADAGGPRPPNRHP